MRTEVRRIAARLPRGGRAASACGGGARWRGVGVAAAIALAAPVPLTGQVEDTTAVVEIPEVVVSVARAPLDLRAAPFAIATSSRSGADRALPGLALDGVLRLVPGVQVDNRYNHALGERISVRGMGARAQFGVRGVKVVFDGIPATLPDGQTALGHVDPAFVQEVEVIRGPASGLWGNAAGGVIQFATAFPPSAGARHVLGLTTGSHGFLRAGLESAGRSADGAYVVHASRLGYGGYREFNRARSLRAHLRVMHRLGPGELQVVAGAVDYDARNPGSLSAEAMREAPDRAFPNNVRQRTGERGAQEQAGLAWTGATPIGLVEWSAYGVRREIENPIPPQIIALARLAGGSRAAVHAARAVGTATLRWSLGLEAAVQRDDRRNFANLEGERGPVTLDQIERVTDLATFGQLAVSSGGLTAVAALRQDRYRFSAADRLVTGENPDDSGSRRLQALSPAIGVAAEVSPRLTMYANATTSFETPTTTELANRPDGAGGFNPELDPQRTRSLELGARATPGTRASLELAVFRLRVVDALIPYEVEAAPGRQFFRNAGSAVHQGLEIAAAADAGRGTRVTVSYAFTDARFREFTVRDVDHSGNRVPGVSPHRLDASVSRRAPAGWSVGLDAAFRSATPVDDANAHEAGGYLLLDAGGTLPFRVAGSRTELVLGVTNLTDRLYASSFVVNAFGGRFYEPGPGRAAYVGLTMAVPAAGRTPGGRGPVVLRAGR